ncbi:vacuolar protein-sorting-associated protein 36 [Kluyveromyces marxianus]|uniref:Vacuolar protein-sorting-associated protein 36 n=1 Tax=Kluyveromyces marxianus TaxID=4911 RepID=A0ABX6EYV2_KLUMA|nr:vacuolar protein-sorting-associated protein 36 [Kluyveromyces marxianus]BAP72039.1 vacuolar protein-sorting-associated protein 36 [Kluyveromyces marxianus]
MSPDFSYWHPVEIAGSGQPLLRENERDIYVEQCVGLYHGKSKILNKQKGRLYLTSQRIIYVDELDAKKESVCIENYDIENIEYSSKFLKRSAKIILFFKDTPYSEDLGNEGGTQQLSTSVTEWLCPICTSKNTYNGTLDSTQSTLPACQTCGVPADKDMAKDSITVKAEEISKGSGKLENTCPVCTFINHPQLRSCEMCGARLKQLDRITAKNTYNSKDNKYGNGVRIVLEEKSSATEAQKQFGQLSFRKTDGTVFYEALAKQLQIIARNESQHLFNQNVVAINGVPKDPVIDPDLVLLNNDMSLIGITALEKNKEHQLLKNNIVMSNALSDLNNLMALAEEIEKMYQEGSNEKKNNSPILFVDREKYLNKEVFLEEIAREIYGFVESELRGDNGIIVTLVDLYALYNKSVRIGTGLISPDEMRQACEKFKSLGLNDLNLIKINGRVLCLAFQDSFDHIRTKISQIAAMKPGVDILQITTELNEYEKNSWSMGVISEVLQYCVTEGDLVIDEQISGTNYYFNTYWKT